MPDLPAPDVLTPVSEEVELFRKIHPDVSQIDCLIADACGILRGKKLPVDGLSKLYRDGVTFPGSLFATDITGSTVVETGLGFDDGDADREDRKSTGLNFSH